jgi:hypothetical protein
MFSNLILAAALMSGAGDFEARTLDGRGAEGKLVELDERHLVVETSEGRSELPLETLATVTAKAPPAPPATKPVLLVELVDETSLAAVEYTVSDGTAHVTTAGGARLDVPTRGIRWVRFRAPGGEEDKLAKQWSEVIQSKADGDLLVVRKADALDYHEGVQGNVDAETCHFEIDSDKVPVNRQKVEGIVYFHPSEAELAESTGHAYAGDGSRLSVAKAKLGGGALELSTPVGLSLSLPLDQVARLDFTAGKVAYLSDLEPEAASYVPYFGFKNELPALDEPYRYRRDVGFDHGPLRLDGKTYRKGLALHSRTVLAYRLPGKFRLFQATLGIDDSARPAGSALVEIKADGKSIWRNDVSGDQPASELELEIGGAKRLEIVVDFGDDLDIGDRIDLCEARVTK